MKNIKIALDISTVRVGIALYDKEEDRFINGNTIVMHKSNYKFSGAETFKQNKLIFLEKMKSMKRQLMAKNMTIGEIVIETSIIPSSTGRKLLMYQASFETLLGLLYPEANVKFIDSQSGQIKALGKNPVYARNNDIKAVSKERAVILAPHLAEKIAMYDDLADAINLCAVSDECKELNLSPKYIEGKMKQELKNAIT